MKNISALILGLTVLATGCQQVNSQPEPQGQPVKANAGQDAGVGAGRSASSYMVRFTGMSSQVPSPAPEADSGRGSGRKTAVPPMQDKPIKARW